MRAEHRLPTAPRCAASLALVALTATAAAQIPANHVVVLTRGAPPAPAAQLLAVDPASGAVTNVGRFPSDGAAPLAVTIDPVSDEVLVAVDRGAASDIVRLTLSGLAVAAEAPVGQVIGRCAQLAVDAGGDVLALVEGTNGALVRFVRRGSGAPSAVVVSPRATAMSATAIFGYQVAIAQSGTSGAGAMDPIVTTVDTLSGLTVGGPYTLPGFTPPGIRGVVELPTAVPRYVLGLEDGSLALLEPFLSPTPTPIVAVPAPPPGGIEALKQRDYEVAATAVGGAAHPFLAQIDPLGATPTWTTLAGPLPGDPVDFDFAPSDAAAFRAFGQSCGTPSPMGVFAARGGAPSLGNAQFALGLGAALPAQPTLTLFGVDEVAPVTLGGGCGVRVPPVLGLATMTDAAGSATFALPIPNASALQDQYVYAQFVQAPGGGAFATSPAAALRLGR